MAIEKEELNRLEDSLVHDVDEEPQPEGWGIYATPKFLSRLTLIAYAVMIVLVLAAALFYRGEKMPIILMPGSLVVAVPFAVVALYLNLTSPAETALIAKRTAKGRWVTGILVYVGLQLLTTLMWIGFALTFQLR